MMQQQGGGLLGQSPAPAAAAAAPAPAPAPASETGSAPLPDLLSPLQVAEALGVAEADVMKIIESGELKAKRIGSAYRIKRSALDAFLAD
jgi:excisionase family DNA binding protein